MPRNEFRSIGTHGFLRTAVATPHVKLAGPATNAKNILDVARRADAERVAVIVFPELSLSGYSNDDLFFQDALLDGVETALSEIVSASSELLSMLAVGAPLRLDGRLYNCAVLVHRGRILGVVPKVYLPNYREFYERRYFTSGASPISKEINLVGERVPFGTDLLFTATDVPDAIIHAEICEDLWVPIPPSTYAAMAGASVLLNLSASNVTIGKTDYRHTLCKGHSGRCIAAYLYSAAGSGESTTDLAWDGHGMIYENGDLLAETPRFSANAEMAAADIDLERLRQERTRTGTFADCAALHGAALQHFRRVDFELEATKKSSTSLLRPLSRFPFVPDEPATLNERCFEAYNIQVHGLTQRLAATGTKRVVIGISGGLDSTQALLVCAKTMDRLGLPRTNILAYTLPGFATTSGTKSNAWKLMQGLGVTPEEIDIGPASLQMLKDIRHPFAEGKKVYDVTFENVQAGARTSLLFRLANHHRAIVVGTGDLSELALGWCTYGVGDHMSHYNVNCSVPKTLIQHLIRWVIDTSHFGEETNEVLGSILDTEISPELVPGEGGAPAQSTESQIGPYELHDFFLYYLTRNSFRPSKVAFLAYSAWRDADIGHWPPAIPTDKRREYDLATIKHWLEVFLVRFFATSQFKRSAVPNGPKVGSGGSLSPRGDWRAPSDVSADVWREELRANVPDT
jgi:NAD+ synthase (glutamine-hydrolysing)